MLEKAREAASAALLREGLSDAATVALKAASAVLQTRWGLLLLETDRTKEAQEAIQQGVQVNLNTLLKTSDYELKMSKKLLRWPTRDSARLFRNHDAGVGQESVSACHTAARRLQQPGPSVEPTATPAQKLGTAATSRGAVQILADRLRRGTTVPDAQ